MDQLIDWHYVNEMRVYDKMVQLCPRLKPLLAHCELDASGQWDQLYSAMLNGQFYDMYCALNALADELEKTLRRNPPVVRRQLTGPRRRGTL